MHVRSKLQNAQGTKVDARDAQNILRVHTKRPIKRRSTGRARGISARFGIYLRAILTVEATVTECKGAEVSDRKV